MAVHAAFLFAPLQPAFVGVAFRCLGPGMVVVQVTRELLAQAFVAFAPVSDDHEE